MNKEQEQGFLREIEEVLHAYEDTYEPGAWEEFDANRKKIKRKWPIYRWSAAAIILLIASFSLYEFMNTDDLQNRPSRIKNDHKQAKNKLDTLISTKHIPSLLKPQAAQVNSSKQKKEENAVPISHFSNLIMKDTALLPEVAALAIVKKLNLEEGSSKNEFVTSGIEKAIAKNESKSAPVYAGAYDSLTNRSRINPLVEKNSSRVIYSVVISPSLSNEKMNFGAGMELSYPINNNFSINSGLMYTALNAKSDGKSMATTSTMQPQSANLAITGIELPLGIQYQTNGGFYAAMGISAVGLINNSLEYSFLEEKTVTLNVVNAGITTEVFKLVSERKTENSAEPLSNYMGFFNFSAGKKQAFGKLSLNIGPFVKVPFSSVSSERIKLLQGGVKLSVDF